MDTVVEACNELIVSARIDIRKTACPKKLDISHSAHHQPSKQLPFPFCQLTGFVLTFQISFIAR